MDNGICLILCAALLFSGASAELLGMTVRSSGKEHSDPNPHAGGYYYGDQSSSSMFSDAEDFLSELVEFYLFLVMLSYVVGYTDWIPWEQNSK